MEVEREDGRAGVHLLDLETRLWSAERVLDTSLRNEALLMIDLNLNI